MNERHDQDNVGNFMNEIHSYTSVYINIHIIYHYVYIDNLYKF